MWSILKRKEKKQETKVDPKAIVATALEAVELGRLKNLLDKGSVNTGTLEIKSGVKIDGQQIGPITVSDAIGIVWISAEAAVQGDVRAPQVYVLGEISGNVVTDTLIIEGRGKVKGRVFAKNVILRQVADIEVAAEFRPYEAESEVEAVSSSVLVPLKRVGGA